MDDDTPNTQAEPMPTVVQIWPRDWARDLFETGTLITQMQVVVAIDFYREPAL